MKPAVIYHVYRRGQMWTQHSTYAAALEPFERTIELDRRDGNICPMELYRIEPTLMVSRSSASGTVLHSRREPTG